jgi:hypothetical protein
MSLRKRLINDSLWRAVLMTKVATSATATIAPVNSSVSAAL